jgi:hypothetical protein
MDKINNFYEGFKLHSTINHCLTEERKKERERGREREQRNIKQNKRRKLLHEKMAVGFFNFQLDHPYHLTLI